MNEEQTRLATERLAAKRAAVLRPRSKKKFLLPLFTGVLVVGIAGALVARMLPEKDSKPAEGAMFAYVPQGGEVINELTDLQGDTARFYQHKADGGVIVRYFIHRGSDGTVSAALDACADCWREAKGHRQEGAEVVCVNCDKRFELAALADGGDPCIPIALPVTVDADKVAVPIPALLEAAKYFKKPYGSL